MSEVLDRPGNALALIPASAISKIVSADTSDILGRLREKLAARRPDASTPAGREEIRSTAHGISKDKVAMVKIGKGLTEGWRASTAAVNAECKIVEEKFTILHDEVRGPLTEWENVEKYRVSMHESLLAELVAFGVFPPSFIDPPLLDVVTRIAMLEGLRERDWQEFGVRAIEARTTSMNSLVKLRGHIEQREAEAAELAEMRADKAKRETEEAARVLAEAERHRIAQAAETARVAAEAEANRQIAAEKHRSAVAAEQAAVAAAKATADAAQAETDRVAAAVKADADRVAAQEKAEADRIDAANRSEIARIAAAHRAEQDRAIAADKALCDQQAAVTAERDRVAAAAFATQAEQHRREADVANRSARMHAATKALVEYVGLPAMGAMAVVLAIVDGNVPNVEMRF